MINPNHRTLKSSYLPSHGEKRANLERVLFFAFSASILYGEVFMQQLCFLRLFNLMQCRNIIRNSFGSLSNLNLSFIYLTLDYYEL